MAQTAPILATSVQNPLQTDGSAKPTIVVSLDEATSDMKLPMSLQDRAKGSESALQAAFRGLPTPSRNRAKKDTSSQQSLGSAPAPWEMKDDAALASASQEQLPRVA